MQIPYTVECFDCAVNYFLGVYCHSQFLQTYCAEESLDRYIELTSNTSSLENVSGNQNSIKHVGLVQSGNHHHCIECNLLLTLNSWKIAHLVLKQQSLTHKQTNKPIINAPKHEVYSWYFYKIINKSSIHYNRYTI
jgi:hypothetical protein